ncbi:MAG: hypothetical protein U1F41_14035 [Burkholderiales bacterium]
MPNQTIARKLRHELLEYAFNVAYLTFVFAAFTQYRRFLLAEYSIAYTNYWLALVGALILGKAIMIGSTFRLGRWLEDRPLIVPTVYKTLLFWMLVLVLRTVEFAVHGVLRGDDVETALGELLAEKGTDELLANSLVVLIALLPFFAVRELGRVLGRERIAALFFRSRVAR